MKNFIKIVLAFIIFEILSFDVGASERVIYGDLNNDGKLDAVDSVMIKQYLAGYELDINELIIDVNGDSLVDSTDAVAMMQYLAGYEVDLNSRNTFTVFYCDCGVESFKGFVNGIEQPMLVSDIEFNNVNYKKYTVECSYGDKLDINYKLNNNYTLKALNVNAFDGKLDYDSKLIGGEYYNYFRVREEINSAFVHTFMYDEILANLREMFPDGKYWNHMGYEEQEDYVNADGETLKSWFRVTDTPCDHDEYLEDYCNLYEGVSNDIYPYEEDSTECWGFASLLSDLMFGEAAPAYYFDDYDLIKVGDQVRFNYEEHTIFVIDKNDEYVTVAECNGDYMTCLIRWGVTYTREEIEDTYGWCIGRR